MIKSYFKLIKPSYIDIKNNKFLFSYPIKDEQLKKSINKYGVLCPLILEKQGEKYNIVSGFKRFLLTFDFINEFPCLVLDESVSDFEKFKISIENNTFFGKKTLNEIEKSNIVYNICNFFDFNEIEIREICKISEIIISKFNIDRSIIMHSFTEDIKSRILDKTLAIESAFDIRLFNKDIQTDIFVIIDKLKLNYNLSKELIKSLKNIYDNINNVLIFKQDIISKIILILSRDDCSNKQKIEEIRKFLLEKLHPDISKREKEFLNLKNKIETKDIKLFHTDYFEDNNFFLNITFKEKDLSDLKNILKYILNL